MVKLLLKPAPKLALGKDICANGSSASSRTELTDYMTLKDRAEPRLFPPQVALHLVKLACELPEMEGRSLSQWDCRELARQLVAAGIVGSISASTVSRVLHSNQLKPWRIHAWLSPKVPRDKAFAKSIRKISRLYTKKLKPDEMVLCVDEKTSLQPRPRLAPTLPAMPKLPVRVEHEYERKGALNLFAAFDTRSGKVWGKTYERKRQVEFIDFLEYLNKELPAQITHIQIVLDNLSVHKGMQVQAWLRENPRFTFHYPPVHCSWMNQVEQWFGILQRKRLRIANFKDKAALAQQLEAFIREWNEVAHPFNWTSKSITKIMAKCDGVESTPTKAA
jgi:transposase